MNDKKAIKGIRDSVRYPIELCNEGKFEELFETIDNNKQNKANLEIIESEIKLFTDQLPILKYELSYIQWILNRNRNFSKKVNEVIRFNWLRLCLNTKKDPDIEYYLDLRGIDREEEVENCIVKRDSENKVVSGLRSTSIDSFFLDQPQKIYLKVITDWYIRRYNLEMGRTLVKIVTERDRFVHIMDRLYPLGFLKLKEVSLVFLLILSLFTYALQTETFEFIDKIKSWLPLFKNPEKIYFPAEIVHSLPLEIIIFSIYAVGFLIIMFIICSKNNILWMHLIVPRLIGAIIIGFLPLIMAEEIWSFASDITFSHAFIIISIMLIVSLFYLFVEVRNQKINTNSEAFKRACSVLIYGLNISLVFSILINDLFGQYFLKWPKEPRFKPLVGMFGIINPQVVIVFASAALLIGIFIQVFWEEKTITEPL